MKKEINYKAYETTRSKDSNSSIDDHIVIDTASPKSVHKNVSKSYSDYTLPSRWKCPFWACNIGLLAAVCIVMATTLSAVAIGSNSLVAEKLRESRNQVVSDCKNMSKEVHAHFESGTQEWGIYMVRTLLRIVAIQLRNSIINEYLKPLYSRSLADINYMKTFNLSIKRQEDRRKVIEILYSRLDDEPESLYAITVQSGKDLDTILPSYGNTAAVVFEIIGKSTNLFPIIDGRLVFNCIICNGDADMYSGMFPNSSVDSYDNGIQLDINIGIVYSLQVLVYDDYGKKMGVFSRQISTISITTVLTNIVQFTPNGSLIFICDQSYKLIATSRGNISEVIQVGNDNNIANWVVVNQSSDIIIRNSAKYISDPPEGDIFLPMPYRMAVENIEHLNLKWILVILTPKSSVFAPVEKLLQDIDTKSAEQQTKMDQRIVSDQNSADVMVLKLRIALPLTALSILCISIVIVFVVINRTIIQPLVNVSDALTLASNLQLDVSRLGVSYNSRVSEVNNLLDSYSRLSTALIAFGKYVPHAVVLQILNNGVAVSRMEKRFITITFMDIERFNTLCESNDTDLTFEVVGDYMEMMSEVIVDNGGTIDKYIGDCIMAVYNAPIPLADHADAACRVSVECRKRLAKAVQRWTECNWPILDFRMGINTGEALVGNVGSTHRLNWTSLGDSVNVASRIESINKYYGSRVLTSHHTVQLLTPDLFLVRCIDDVTVMGRSDSLPIYEVIAIKQEATAQQIKMAETLEKGRQYFADRQVAKAVETWSEIPDDPVAVVLKNRGQSILAGLEDWYLVKKWQLK